MQKAKCRCSYGSDDWNVAQYLPHGSWFVDDVVFFVLFLLSLFLLMVEFLPQADILPEGHIVLELDFIELDLQGIEVFSFTNLMLIVEYSSFSKCWCFTFESVRSVSRTFSLLSPSSTIKYPSANLSSSSQTLL